MSNELSKRAVACKGWRWMQGMSVGGMLVVDADSDGLDVVRKGCVQEWPLEYAFPDLNDPATLGCLLQLVREAWGEATACTAATREADGARGWIMDAWLPVSPFEPGPYPTEAEALVAALEAAEDGG
jgi:hypothetical protein